MADEKPHELLIIKRVRSHDDHGHGGAWKIAFADFMTAMMALFLVMWLISATNEKTKASLARYFNPVKLVDLTVQKRGLHDPADRSQEDADTDQPPPSKPGPKDPKPEAKPDKVPAGHPKDGNADSSKNTPANYQPTHSEAALFRDPYAVLAEIAAAGPALSPGDKAEHPNVGAAASFQDPFQVGAPVVPEETAPQTAAQGTPDQPIPGGIMPPAASVATPPQPTNAKAVPAAQPKETDKSLDHAAARSAAAPQAADQTSRDAQSEQARGDRSKSEQAKAESSRSAADDSAKAKTLSSDNDKAQAAATKAQSAPSALQQPTLSEEATRLQKAIAGALGGTAAAPTLQVKPTKEGVMISLTDGMNYAMFAIGSAEPQPRTVRIMEKIAQILKKAKGDIVITGHTDGRRYKSRNYDNWRLSEARAQMALYMLVRGGLDEKRVTKIEGAADHDLKVPSDPLAAENRRIEILLRKSPS